MTDLGDAKEVKKEKRNHKNAATIAREELKAILDDRRVRNFVWTLLQECGIHHIVDPAASEREVGIHDGERNIGNKIVAKIDNAVPHMYMKIYTENRKEEGKNE